MRLEQAHLMHPWTKLYEPFLENTVVQSKTNFKFCKCFIFKVVHFPKKVRKAYSMGALDALVQGRENRTSFKIKRVILEMALESAIFRQKSPHIFSDTNPSNFIICKFIHFKQLFSLQNLKTTYYEPFKAISTMYFISEISKVVSYNNF